MPPSPCCWHCPFYRRFPFLSRIWYVCILPVLCPRLFPLHAFFSVRMQLCFDHSGFTWCCRQAPATSLSPPFLRSICRESQHGLHPSIPVHVQPHSGIGELGAGRHAHRQATSLFASGLPLTSKNRKGREQSSHATITPSCAAPWGAWSSWSEARVGFFGESLDGQRENTKQI